MTESVEAAPATELKVEDTAEAPAESVVEASAEAELPAESGEDDATA